MDRKITIPVIILSGITELMTLRIWWICKNFTDLLHHSSINLNLQIEGYVHAEKGPSLFMTRMFNNKLIDNLIDLLRFYLQFWDVRFGTNWFSLLGYLGIFAGFYYIFSNKEKTIYHWLILIVLSLLPWIEIILEPHIAILLKSLYLWLPFSLFSLYGIYQYITHGNTIKRLALLGIFIIVSLCLIFFLPNSFSRYCVR